VVRTQVSPEVIRQRVRAAIDEIDRDQSFFDVQTMEGRVERIIWQQRVATAVLGVFGTIALGLAIVGVYAVTAHAVASERREIGIRLALGSPRADVVGLMMRRWLTPVVVGIVGGILGGVATARAWALSSDPLLNPTSSWQRCFRWSSEPRPSWHVGCLSGASFVAWS
jgi:putative ABC transport system permease protein